MQYLVQRKACHASLYILEMDINHKDAMNDIIEKKIQIEGDCEVSRVKESQWKFPTEDKREEWKEGGKQSRMKSR